MILTAGYFDSYFRPLSYVDSGISDVDYSYDAPGDRCETLVECCDTFVELSDTTGGCND